MVLFGLRLARPVARTFRDVHGLANQLLAREAGRVVLVVAGLPVVLKGQDPSSTS